MMEGAHTFYTFEGAVKLRTALQSLGSGKVAVVVSGLPYKCPGAPHEGAMLIADTFKKRGHSDKVEVHLFTPEPQPMPVAGPALGEAVEQMLRSRGVHFHPLHKLTGVDTVAHELTFEGKSPFGYDLLVAVPPHRGPRIVHEAGLANETSWVPVERATLQTRYENVFAIGDVAAIPIPGRWKPEVPLMLPKAGVFAHAQAEVVAHRIAAEITGAGVQGEFPGFGYCMLEAGESLAGFAFGNFFNEPAPQVEIRKIGQVWHWGKLLLEQWWLTSYGPKRSALRQTLMLGGKVFGIPVLI
jgi:sulfide:quinone oxidoreductase